MCDRNKRNTHCQVIYCYQNNNITRGQYISNVSPTNTILMLLLLLLYVPVVTSGLVCPNDWYGGVPWPNVSDHYVSKWCPGASPTSTLVRRCTHEGVWITFTGSCLTPPIDGAEWVGAISTALDKVWYSNRPDQEILHWFLIG